VVLVAVALAASRLLTTGEDAAKPGPGPAIAAGPIVSEPSSAPATPKPSDPEPSDPEPSDPEPTSPGPTAQGLVTVDPSVTGDRVEGVAAMFDSYFGGINAHDMSRVAAVLDPAGSVNPNSAKAMKNFAAGTATTRDDLIILQSLTGTGTQSRARITFRSRQASGQGPKSNPAETCTEWTIDYIVTVDAGGRYRIAGGKAAHQPC
jgi:hypothetical protein